jgi:hypothetical protein
MKFISKTILFSLLLLLLGFISFAQVKPTLPLETTIKPSVPMEMFDSQVHVYLDPRYARGVIAKSPGYINGYAKIGRLMEEKGEFGETVYSEGYIDNEGRIIISPNNYALGNFSEGLVSVCNKLSNGSYKLGFMDVTGKVVIPLIYQCDSDPKFSEGLCQVIGSNGKYGFINKLGKVIIPFLYGDVGVEGFKNGIARVAKTDFIKDPMTINKLGKVASEQSNNNSFAEKFIDGTNKTATNVSGNLNAKSAVQKKAVPQTYKKTLYKLSCELCGKSYLGKGFGYRIVNDAGKRKLEVHEASGDNMSAFNIVKNKYESYECARKAGNEELRGN